MAQGDSLWSFMPIWPSTGRNATYCSAGLKLKPCIRLVKQLNTTMNTYPWLRHCPLLLGGSELCSVAGQGHHIMHKSVSMEGDMDISITQGQFGSSEDKDNDDD